MGYYYPPSEDNDNYSKIFPIFDSIIFILVLFVCYIFYRVFEAPVTEECEEAEKKEIQSIQKKRPVRKILKAKRLLPSKFKKLRAQEAKVEVVEGSEETLQELEVEKVEKGEKSPMKKVQWEDPTEQIAHLDEFFEEERKTTRSNSNKESDKEDVYEEKKGRASRRKMLTRKILEAKRLLISTSKDKEVESSSTISGNTIDSDKSVPITSEDNNTLTTSKNLKWGELKKTPRGIKPVTDAEKSTNLFPFNKKTEIPKRWEELNSVLEPGTVRKNLSWWEEQLALPEPVSSSDDQKESGGGGKD